MDPEQRGTDERDLTRRIAALETATEQSRLIIGQTGGGYDDQQRGWIARTIIWVFVAVVFVGLVILLLEGILTGSWKGVTAQSTDLIKSTVLPVVTLVLGYYFGRSGRG